MNHRFSSILLLVALTIAVPLRAAEQDPLDGVGQMLISGKAAEARARIVKVREAYVAAGNVSGDAVASLLLGLADVGLHKAEEARLELQRSAAKFAAVDDQFGGWMALWVAGDLENGEGRFDAAIAAHERALALLSAASQPGARFTLETMKALGPIFGAPTDMLGPLAQSPEIVKPILLLFAEVVSRDAYGAALMESGAFEKADAQLTKASEMSALFGGLFDPTIAEHLGDLRRRQWRLDEARQSFMKALDGVKLLPQMPVRNPAIEVGILGDLAELELLCGRVDDALAWNDRALKIVREATPAREPSTLEARGNLLGRAGRYTEAEAILEEALKLATKNGNDRQRASILAALGGVHMFEGTYGTAAMRLEQSIELYQKLNEPYVEAPIWLTLAEVYTLLENHDSVAAALEKARELAKKSEFKAAAALVDVVASFWNKGQRPSMLPADAFAALLSMPEAKGLMLSEDAARLVRGMYALSAGGPSVDPGSVSTALPAPFQGIALMLKGKALLERGDNAGARALWKEALTTNPNRDHRAGYLALIGASYWREADRTDAIRYFEQAAQAIDSVAGDLRVEELLAGYLGSNRRIYYELLIDMLVQQGRVKEAFEQAERARARAFLQVVGNHRLNAERGGDAALVRQADILRTQISAWEKQANERTPADAVRLTSDLQFARQQYNSLMARIKVSSPEYAAVTTVEPLQLDDLRNDLPEDATLVSYFVSPNYVYAWVLDRTELHHATLPIDGAALQRVVCWAARFGPVQETRGVELLSTKCGAATAEEAYAMLIAPLRANIHTARVIVVPHGVLHYVPFAALRDGASGRYLLEDYTLSYVPSASALRFLRSKETPVTGGALVLGNPHSPIPAAGQLPGAQEEAVTVARYLHTTPLLGGDARESVLYHLGGKIDLVHIAAHAFYDSTNPLFSRVALAAGEGYDGNLEVHEILSSLDLSGVNLVVLSACQTAVGRRSGGDDVVGLTRALLYAGTPGVISTLWNVDDESTVRLMNEFYRRLCSGEPVADALRGAQLKLCRDGKMEPKYWAAFTLTGDPQGRWKSQESIR